MFQEKKTSDTNISWRDLARIIDHTLLKPDAGKKEIIKLCDDGCKYGFASVCVNPGFVDFAAKQLEDSSVKVCSVVGFPLGSNTTQAKIYEAKQLLELGAAEIDMVMNIGALKDNEENLVTEEILSVVELCHQQKRLCKVIIEAGLLNNLQKVKACRLISQAGADFVKTSTGFIAGGAVVSDVRLLASTLKDTRTAVKASGGIRCYSDAVQMVNAGASRLGTSSGLKIVQEAQSQGRS